MIIQSCLENRRINLNWNALAIFCDYFAICVQSNYYSGWWKSIQRQGTGLKIASSIKTACDTWRSIEICISASEFRSKITRKLDLKFKNLDIFSTMDQLRQRLRKSKWSTKKCKDLVKDYFASTSNARFMNSLTRRIQMELTGSWVSFIEIVVLFEFKKNIPPSAFIAPNRTICDEKFHKPVNETEYHNSGDDFDILRNFEWKSNVFRTNVKFYFPSSEMHPSFSCKLFERPAQNSYGFKCGMWICL